jgi:hypothetical protein
MKGIGHILFAFVSVGTSCHIAGGMMAVDIVRMDIEWVRLVFTYRECQHSLC